MKTAQLLNYARGQWIPGPGQLADIARAIDGSARRDHRLGRDRLRAPCSTTPATSAARPCASSPSTTAPGSSRASASRSWRARRSCTSSIISPARPARTAGSTSRAAPAPCSASRRRAAASCPTPTSCSTARSSPCRRRGSFIGQHIYTPMQGAAVHINAFNFPVWGMLEKLAPTLLAGMPAIVKPASSTAYLCEAAVRIMVDSGLLPDGALQLIVGGVGDLFDHLTGQDVVSFTGSAATALEAQVAPGRRARKRQVRRRAGQPQRLDPRPRRRARARPNSTCSSRKWSMR